MKLIFLRCKNISIIDFKGRNNYDEKYCTGNKLSVSSQAKINSTQFYLGFRGFLKFTNRRFFEFSENRRSRICSFCFNMIV